MKSLVKNFCFALLFALISVGVVQAQETSALTGTVTDTTGALLQGTTVTLTNPLIGFSASQLTDATGGYHFVKLPVGSGFEAVYSHDGFSAAKVSDITLSLGITRTQNVKLALGKSVETVEVSAKGDIVTINTTDASIGNNIDVTELNDLPIYDRSNGITTLFTMQAGVDATSTAVTGSRVDQTTVSVDGLDVKDIAAGDGFSVAATAPVDSVAQFTGNVAGLNSDTGTGAGGQFKLATKGGTNKFHGNLNEYHRDTSTVANTWFNNFTGVARAALIQNQFGADIGGPIKRDKLFFYFDWADSRIIQSGTAERIVPLDGFRNGNVNYVNNGTGCSSSSRLNTAAGCISAVSKASLASYDPAGIGLNTALNTFITTRYPHANDASYASADGVNTGGYRFTYPSPDTRHTYVAKIDYNLSETQKIFGRTTITRRDGTYYGPYLPGDPNVVTARQDHSYAYVVGHTWNIGKNKVNQFVYGDTVEKYGFPNMYNATGANQFSFTGLDGPYRSVSGQGRRVPIPMLRDDFTWQKGNHSIVFGGTFKFIKTHSYLSNNYNFVSGGMAGSMMGTGFDSSVRPSDILNNATVQTNYDKLFATALGPVGTTSTNFVYDNKLKAVDAGVGAQRAYRYFQTEAYFGDTWKVTPKLSLDYGVRYQYYSVPYEAKGAESIAVMGSGAPNLDTYMAARVAAAKAGNTSSTALPLFSYKLAGKANNGANLYDPNWKDFAPHVGFAYTPYANGKTVINGGIGIVYDRTVINAINFLQDQISYLFYSSNSYQATGSDAVDTLANAYRIGSNLSVNSSVLPTAPTMTAPYTPYVDGDGTPFGLAEGDTSFVIDPKLKDPYNIAFNVGIQQDLPFHNVLKVNYVGRLGRRLLADVDASQVVDVPDYSGKSTQTMVQAMAEVTKQIRAGKTYSTVTAQPWFENNMGYFPSGRRTYYATGFGGSLPGKGDLSDWVQTLAAYSYYYYGGLFPQNMGIPAQFGTNAFLTNHSSSNYHGLLVTLDKNMSNGLRYEFNYTWSHSVDNASLSANSNSLFSNNGMVCDYYQARACRGDSDFDVRQEISSNFTYNLPIGHGHAYANHINKTLDEVIGGWTISGMPTYRTGLAATAYSGAYLSGFDNNSPAIFTGTSRADLKTKVNVNHTSNTVWMFDGGVTGAAKVASEFRGPIGLEYGQRNYLRGPGYFNLDAGLAKDFNLYQDYKLRFRADAYNALNHPSFDVGALNVYSNAGNFGQISGMASGYRVAQFSLRLEF